MDYLKITGIILGAKGLWMLIDSLIKWRGDKKLKNAEASNFFAQANKEVVGSFLQLSQELKEQMQRQKERIDELEKSVEDEKKRNDELEELIGKLEKRNRELEAELNKLKNVKSSEQ